MLGLLVKSKFHSVGFTQLKKSKTIRISLENPQINLTPARFIRPLLSNVTMHSVSALCNDVRFV